MADHRLDQNVVSKNIYNRVQEEAIVFKRNKEKCILYIVHRQFSLVQRILFFCNNMINKVLLHRSRLIRYRDTPSTSILKTYFGFHVLMPVEIYNLSDLEK